ncbi:MAG TPA: hypothetical protein VFI47_00180, partial [Acidimicrobiales bacterium]|nr:hypothetical protein [Acidimicrobiales bacterium]
RAAMALPVARAEVMVAGRRDESLDVDEAFAYADCFVRTVPPEALAAAHETAEPPDEVTGILRDTAAGCREGG